MTRERSDIAADFAAGIPLSMDGERKVPRRTPEAEAQIAAARAKSDDPPMTCVKGQGVGCARDDMHTGLCRRWDGTVLAAREPPTDFERAMQEGVDEALEGALSDLRDTPAVRQFGTPKRVIACEHLEVTDPAERERLGLPPMSPAGQMEAAVASGHWPECALDRDHTGVCCDTTGRAILVKRSNEECARYLQECMAAVAEQQASRDPPPADKPHVGRDHSRLMPHDNGGPACNHLLWTMGCRPCADWAVANGVEFARHMASRSWAPQPDAGIHLTGDDAGAWSAFQTAAAALEEHAESGQKLQTDYLQAQAKLARAAAKRVRGR